MSIQTKSLGAKASLSVLGFSAAELVVRRCVRLAPSGDRRPPWRGGGGHWPVETEHSLLITYTLTKQLNLNVTKTAAFLLEYIFVNILILNKNNICI